MNKERNLSFDPPKVERPCVEKLSHNIVSDWVEETGISLRPADKAALKRMMGRYIPSFFEENYGHLCEKYLETVKLKERLACIDAISNLEEPISGLINKQRTLNACTYSHRAKESESASSTSRGKHSSS